MIEANQSNIIIFSALLTIQAFAIFLFFRKKSFSYDTIAQIAKYSLIGFPIGISLLIAKQILFGAYSILSSLLILGLYMEYVSFARKKDEGYVE